MKRIYLTVIFLLISGFTTYSQTPETYIIRVNKFDYPVTRTGQRGNQATNDSLISYNDKTAAYSGGFFMSGIINDSLWCTFNGIMLFIGGVSFPPFSAGKLHSDPADSINRIYVIERTDPEFGLSWQEWKGAVENGAFFYDGDEDGNYNPVDLNSNGRWDPGEDKPDMPGDITLYTVYNDKYESDLLIFEGLIPRGIEIRNTFFAFGKPGSFLDNIIFSRIIIEYKGNDADRIDSVFFSIYDDPDINYYEHNLSGCDTSAYSCFTFNKRESEDTHVYLTKLLQGPQSSVPGETFIDNNGNGMFDPAVDSPLDTAVLMRGEPLGELEKPGYRNTGLSSFTSIIGGSSLNGDPDTKEEMRYYSIGGLTKSGDPINVADFPYGNGSTLGSDTLLISPKYMYSGNPVTETGWLQTLAQDCKTIITSGPFTLHKNQPVEIIFANIGADGSSWDESLTIASYYDSLTQVYYESNFTQVPVGVDETAVSDIPDNYLLMQNYPNPFNPVTHIEYYLPADEKVKLTVFDVLGREVSVLINSVESKGKHTIAFNGEALPSGIYFYELKTENYHDIKKMILLK